MKKEKCEHIEQSLFWICKKCGKKIRLRKDLGEELVIRGSSIPG